MQTSPIRSAPALLSVLSLVAGLAGLAACSNENQPTDDGIRKKMADDLVACQNERSSLKDKVAELTAELNKLKAQTQSDAIKHLDGLDLRGGSGDQGATKKVVDHEGDIAPAALSKVVKTNSATLRACYDKGLKHNPNLQYVSSVNVHFSVANTGVASDVSFSPHADREMEKCMSAAIVRWKFPTFNGNPVSVEAPVNLVAK
jgi:hypothetical protein